MSELSRKSAIVTGSTSGIGLGIAEALVAAGVNVMLNGFGDQPAIDSIRKRLESVGSARVSYHAANLLDPDEITGLIDSTARTFGSVDILVNNAGVQYVSPVVDFPRDKWDELIALNLSAPFHATRAALPGMLEAGWGRVINIASTHGLVASVNKAAYVASKHGLIGLTKVAALETAETGVTVNAIAPGWVLTPLVEAQIRSRAAAANQSFEEASALLLSEKQPSRQFVTPQQIGAMVVFLCGSAANQIRGQTMVIDGGWTAQ